MATSIARRPFQHALVLAVALGTASASRAQARFPYPTEPVTVRVEVMEDIDESRAEQIRERFKSLSETADLVGKLEGKRLAFAVKKDLKLKWSDLKSALESSDEAAPLTLGDPVLAGRVRLRFDSELAEPERKALFASGISRLRSMAGVTYSRTTKDGGVELVVGSAGIKLSSARALVAKVMKLPEDLDPFYEVTWCGAREPPRIIQPGCEED